MTLLFGALLALSALALSTIVGWAMAAALNGPVARAVVNAGNRAALLCQLRLLPLVLAAVVVPTQIYAFVRYEAGRDEAVGPLLMCTASLGVWFLTSAVRRGVAMRRHTAAVVRAWRTSALPLTLPRWTRPAWSISPRFPVVAVVGVLRPQLFVARQVAETCSAEELAAIAAHEAAHVQAYDNMMRALFHFTPGAGTFGRVASALETAWLAAAEQAADARAQALTSGVELASALTKVARLAADQPRELLPVSALIDGQDLRTRVTRLLAATDAGAPSRLAWLPTALLFAAAVALQSTPLAAELHQLFELLVRHD